MFRTFLLWSLGEIRCEHTMWCEGKFNETRKNALKAFLNVKVFDIDSRLEHSKRFLAIKWKISTRCVIVLNASALAIFERKRKLTTAECICRAEQISVTLCDWMRQRIHSSNHVYWSVKLKELDFG